MNADSTKLFSNRAENYAKYRPSYPQAVLECLRDECGLTPTDVIADIGSGTGILSELFLKNGNPVFGVEPNDEMRETAERLLSYYPNFSSVNGTAEATTLPDNSVDFITAGQAFHWFDRPKAKPEFWRILRPGSHTVLVWNSFDFDGAPFMGAYERLLARYSGKPRRVDWEEKDQDVASFFNGRMAVRMFDNPRTLDFATLKGGYLSSSHAPLAGHPQHEPLIRDLRELFDTFQESGVVRFLNVTRMYFGQWDSGRSHFTQEIMMPLQTKVTREFERRFGVAPAFVVRAPGRVNLIGEHTDYNDGFVLPMAINRAIWIAGRPRDDGRLVAHSLDLGQTVECLLENIHKETGWGEYLKGVAWALQEAGYALQAWEGIVSGDVPIGAGLSSSAAMELATARVFAVTSGFPWEPATMAKIGQRAENEWVGMNCGIMDQMISAAGKADHALLIDCRSLETQSVPLPPGTSVVVLDTATRRGLVDSAYNERRAQCEAAAHFFEVPALRDVSVAQFQAQADQLDEITRRRARHVVTENDRTLQAAEAMRQGDAVELGQLMNDSHTSLRDDFEVSCDELNAMVVCAQREDACYGARMTGGGFGGCAVALVRADAAQAFAATVAACYQETTGNVPNVYVCSATNGAEVVEG